METDVSRCSDTAISLCSRPIEARLLAGVRQLDRGLTQLQHQCGGSNCLRRSDARPFGPDVIGAPHAPFPGALEAQHSLGEHRQTAGLLLGVAQPPLPICPYRLQRLQCQKRLHLVMFWSMRHIEHLKHGSARLHPAVY